MRTRAAAATPVGLPVVAARTVSLSSGGSVRIELIDTNVFELDREDRVFLEDLIKLVEFYENQVPRAE